MEYASGGELYDYIDDKKGLEDKEARKFFRQIVSAINYLHQVRKMHICVDRHLKRPSSFLKVVVIFLSAYRKETLQPNT